MSTSVPQSVNLRLRGCDVAVGAVVAFIAWGHIIHWIPTIRWIGYSFVGGILFTVTMATAMMLLTSRSPRHRFSARSPQPPAAAFSGRRQWSREVAALKTRQSHSKTPVSSNSERISALIDILLEYIIRDFVNSWYGNISKDLAFLDQVDNLLRIIVCNLRDRMLELDLAELVISRIVPIITDHLRDFRVAEVIVRGRKLNRTMTETEELDLAIASKFRDGELHPAASLSFPDLKMIQQDYLRGVASKIIPCVLPPRLLTSLVVSTFVREIVACSVLMPVTGILNDPDTWNQLMENVGRTMLQDRSTVRRLRAALDEHAPDTAISAKMATISRLTPEDTERQFEKFIRAIRRVNNLSDARRFRSEVTSQLKKDSQQDGVDQVYLRRLEMGKRVLDQKVQQLMLGSANIDTRRPPILSSSASVTPVPSRLETASLVEILKDPSGMSYFMEYMDRQRQMSLVQFWLVVDGFRNPLEEDIVEEELPATLPEWKESDRLDLQQMDSAYLACPELSVTHQYRPIVQEFLAAGSNATPLQYYKARKAILSAQSAVLDQMNSHYYSSFKKSDLFFKCLASQEASSNQLVVPSSPNTGLDPLSSSSTFPVKPQIKKRSSPSFNIGRITKPSRPISHRRGASIDNHLTSSRFLLDDDETLPISGSDEVDPDVMTESLHSLDFEIAEPRHHIPDKQIVKAMEQALVDILEDDSQPRTTEDLRASLFGNEDVGPTDLFSEDNESLRNSIGLTTTSCTKSLKEQDKPSLSSLGLVSPASRIGVFQDDDLFGDEDNISDNHEETEENPDYDNDDDEPVHAAPGDLGLAEVITGLTKDINKLISQDAIVESLTKKAELVNNTTELRILRKSKASIQRELRRKELQRQHYIIQESDNSLFGRSTIRIKSTTTSKDDEGREFVLYIVEVQRNAGEQIPAVTWEVIRRYSEFHELYQKLRMLYPSVRSLEFPRRRVVMKFQADFLRKRRLALEKYLQELLQLPEVCRSCELRTFLSQSAIRPLLSTNQGKKNMMTRLYDSVTDGVEDILGNLPVFDQLSLAGQNLLATATNQFGANELGLSEDGTAVAEAEAELNAFEDKYGEPFIKPICDIFLEVFELNQGNNWLRGRAVVVVLQQLLGGTIERKVRDSSRSLIQEDAVVKYISTLTNSMWPDGQLNRNKKPRTPQEKKMTRTEASLLLATLIPDLAGSVVGRVNAQAASRRIFATLNNARLNTHLTFTLLDEIVKAIFEEGPKAIACG